MEDVGAFKSDNEVKQHPLTPLRFLRGMICLVVFICTASMLLLYLGPAVAVLLRFFSLHYSRKVTAFFLGSWLALWPFLFEKINKTKVVFSGDTVPARERVLLIANHRTEVDWMYLWDLALWKGRLGYIKYMLKSSLMKLPVFGWGFHILEFISVERKWNVDEPILIKYSQLLQILRIPCGLRYSVKELTSRNKNAEIVRNMQQRLGFLYWRMFCFLKQRVFMSAWKLYEVPWMQYFLTFEHSQSTAVYDLTIGYKPQCPSFLDNVFGVDPSEVHIHVRLVPVSDIPAPEDGTGTWLMEPFQLKDRLLLNFKAQGSFPDRGMEQELSTMHCSLNFAAVILLTAAFAYLTLFSSSWFKVYIALACVYLSFATYLKFQPSPILESLKSLYCKKNQ